MFDRHTHRGRGGLDKCIVEGGAAPLGTACVLNRAYLRVHWPPEYAALERQADGTATFTAVYRYGCSGVGRLLGYSLATGRYVDAQQLTREARSVALAAWCRAPSACAARVLSRHCEISS